MSAGDAMPVLMVGYYLGRARCEFDAGETQQGWLSVACGACFVGLVVLA